MGGSNPAVEIVLTVETARLPGTTMRNVQDVPQLDIFSLATNPSSNQIPFLKIFCNGVVAGY